MDARYPPISATPVGSDQLLLYRDEFRSILSSLSHELSRPLISLRAGFEMLLETAGDEVNRNQGGHVHTMLSLCDDLLQLTQGYLDFASMVRRRRPLSWGTYSLGALLNELESQFAPMAIHRGIDLDVYLENPEATVRTDVSRCQQIFANLVSNALKFTKTGGSVTLRGRVEHDSWSISIIDTGDGIPVEAFGKVFEPFYRLARDDRAGVEGSGLGLAICRELAEQLHGEIQLESTLEQGTTVTVRFPCTHHGELPEDRATRLLTLKNGS